MKFLHTADLQIGARFAQFGDKAEILRGARLTTLERVLEIAKENAVNAVLIAGDMFESNQIANSLAEEAFDILSAHAEIPIVVLPGNHDPLDGPGCIWQRKPFAEPPAHVKVCTTRDPIEIAGAVILPVPITQKVSTKDPSLPMIDAAASIPEGTIKIGLTHGALAIEGKHQPSDQPIALDAATRAGLDYLAAGHWHKPQAYDDGRLVMSGTPEPDDFGQGSGSVTLVEIFAPGRQPTITHLDTATYAWQTATLDLLNRAPTLDVVSAALADIGTPPDHTVLRVEVSGPVSAEHREQLSTNTSEVTKDFAAVLVDDNTSTVLSESIWASYLQQHPLLAQVVADVERLRLFHTGRPPSIEDAGLDEMTPDEFLALCSALKIEPELISEETFDFMMGLLTAEVGRTTTACDD
jgi:DNA repair exonuclease SbcCD nuclease subunit